jgi:hypothetical protein
MRKTKKEKLLDAVQKSIDHWKRMIKWASNRRGFLDWQVMEDSIKENFSDEYCSLCQFYNHKCSLCILRLNDTKFSNDNGVEGCSSEGSTWRYTIGRRPNGNNWRAWAERAKEMVKLLNKIKRKVSKE